MPESSWWRKVWHGFLTAMGAGAGKLLLGVIVGAFALVLFVVPRMGDDKMAAPASAEVAADEPMAAPPVAAAAPDLPRMAPDDMTEMAGPNPDPWIRDSVAVCAGLSSWRFRHGADSLRPDLQASLKRLEGRCGWASSDSVAAP